MGFLQGTTEKLFFAVLVLLGGAAAVIGFISAFWAGMIITGLILAMLAAVIVWICMRYREIDRLTRYLNRVLYGEYTLDNFDNEEGELKILKSEIYKMTVRLRE